MQVLFCGHMMRQAFRNTRDMVRAGIVEGCSDLMIEECSSANLPEAIKDAHVVVPLMSKIDRTLLASAENLKLILQYGVGVEGVDIQARAFLAVACIDVRGRHHVPMYSVQRLCRIFQQEGTHFSIEEAASYLLPIADLSVSSSLASERGVMVSNMPSQATGNALSCAEHAIMLTLMLLRDWTACQESVQSQTLGAPTGITLFGRTVLILGFGNIAKELIPRLLPFGVRLMCARQSSWDNLSVQEQAMAHLVHVRGVASDLPNMLPDADIVIVTASQTTLSRGFVGSSFLRHCKAGVRIVNVSRGGLLDYDAILQGLNSGSIGGLALDVQWSEPFDPNDPVATHPKVLLTPHVAGVTKLSYANMARTVITESLSVKLGRKPSVWLNEASMQPATPAD